MGPFSASDQVSAVLKLSLFGRKKSQNMSRWRRHIPPATGMLSSVCAGVRLRFAITKLGYPCVSYNA